MWRARLASSALLYTTLGPGPSETTIVAALLLLEAMPVGAARGLLMGVVHLAVRVGVVPEVLQVVHLAVVAGVVEGDAEEEVVVVVKYINLGSYWGSNNISFC